MNFRNDLVRAYLEGIDGKHDRMLLRSMGLESCWSQDFGKGKLTAIPANAPAAIFWRRVKSGGRLS